jgi:conjugative relaxase-like TrwC/TraI family protein
MIRLHTATSATGVKNYFGTADYYSQGTETIGRWGGGLADDLGLKGSVTQTDFGMMSDNINPVTGKRLTLRTNANRRIGEDIIFSLPKDVGAFIMLRPPEERDALLAMVERRVYEVMGIIEADVETRVRKDGAFENRPGSGLAYAGFFHTTARPVEGQIADPHPHWHMFCFNATRDGAEDGRIKAADFANIFRDRPYYEALFYSRVAADFQQLRRAIERRPEGKWGLAELDSLNGTFSKRTDGIEETARLRGITDPGVKSKLGAKTRKKKDKDQLPPEQLRDGWLDQLTDDQRDAMARVAAGMASGSQDVTAAEAVDFAFKHCSEKLSVMPERELKRVAMLFGLGSVSPEEVDREMLAPRHGLVVNVIDGRRMVTT